MGKTTCGLGVRHVSAPQAVKPSLENDFPWIKTKPPHVGACLKLMEL